SESLPGCLRCRAASVADGDPTTAWNTPFVGITNQWVQLDAPKPITVDRMRLQVVADGRHSLPTGIELQVDGAERELRLPPIRNRAAENATVAVTLHFPPMRGSSVRVTVVAATPQLATRESTGDTVPAPVGNAELGIPGLRVGRAPATVPSACRTDLVTIDGHPFPVRVTGAGASAGDLSALSVTPCDPRVPGRVPTIHLGGGNHLVRTSDGLVTGLQIDRLALGSAAGGAPLAMRDGRVTGFGEAPLPAPHATMVHNGATRMRVHVTGADAPFWLVLGESQSDGWRATIAHE